MNKSTSLYLDFLRVIAAFGVLLVHASLPWFSNDLFLRTELGHRLVMVFFVLSGYLIAFTVDKKNKDGQTYLVDRFSRLYSVVLPALIFTYAADFIGKQIDPVFYSQMTYGGHQALKFLTNLTYLQQIWTLCATPSTNGPFWSISYEFWYYMVFWVLCYFKGYKRAAGVLLVALIIGPKILVLLPVWLLGVLTYKASGRLTINSKLAGIIFFITLAVILWLTSFKDVAFLQQRFPYGKAPLYFSSQFLFDWVYGICIALNIYSFTNTSLLDKAPVVIEKAIRHLSSITFSLYLFHIPILCLVSRIVPYNKASYLQVTLVLIGVIVLVNMLSAITEKQRRHFKKFFELLFNKFNYLSVR